jgi:carboxyl-terminal processing protease
MLCCLVKLTKGQQQPILNLSTDERVYSASKVYSLLLSYFVSGEGASDPRIDASYKSYLRTVMLTGNRRQFDLATMEFVAQLRNGHTFFWDASLDKDNRQPLGFYAASRWGQIRLSNADFYARRRILV